MSVIYINQLFWMFSLESHVEISFIMYIFYITIKFNILMDSITLDYYFIWDIILNEWY